VSWLAPDANGVQNVWARPAGADSARAVTHETHRPIRWYAWSAGGTHLLYLQDGDGDENDHLFAADLATGAVKDLTPFPGVRAQNVLVSAARRARCWSRSTGATRDSSTSIARTSRPVRSPSRPRTRATS
jgi:hypothetical protein